MTEQTTLEGLTTSLSHSSHAILAGLAAYTGRTPEHELEHQLAMSYMALHEAGGDTDPSLREAAQATIKKG